jgi:AGCS family alanine or glycine:cation symporter
VFSNEAGLGSSVMVHSASNVVEPVKQGMWGIFEVFADTIVVCTLTAFSILSTGLIDLETGVMLTANEKTALVSEAFGSVFNIGNVNVGGAFIAIAILLFAFSTVLGWSYYGTKAWEFLFGTKSTIIYKVVFVVFIVFGATMSLDLAWDISDTFNGLMALPNLIGVLTLSGTVIKITKNYVARTFKGSKEKPMLSVFPDIQKEQEIKLANEPE